MTLTRLSQLVRPAVSKATPVRAFAAAATKAKGGAVAAFPYKEAGVVTSIADGVAEIRGITECFSGELIHFQDNNLLGMAIALKPNSTGVVVFGDASAVREGSVVYRSNRAMTMPVGPELLGRTISPMGFDLNSGEKVVTKASRLIDSRAPGIITRATVEEPMQSGVRVIDSITPVGRGQRQLVIGDRQTGKTCVAIDAILNQRRNNRYLSPDGLGADRLFCIYVAVGQKQSSVANLSEKLRQANASWYTTMVVAGSSDTASLQYLAPYAGAAVGEYYRDNGMHALIVYDDLSKQAVAYRQMSLLLRKPAGREAYPGDVFYMHSRLLERSCKLSKRCGFGSLTALPIIETQEGDVSTYIPTNVISITDGQIMLDTELFSRGIKPAINVGLSVSRIGSKAQTEMMKNASGTIKSDMAQFREVEALTKFGGDLDKATMEIIRRGQALVGMLIQMHSEPMYAEEQIALVLMGTNGLCDNIGQDSAEFNKDVIQKLYEPKYRILLEGIFKAKAGKDKKFGKFAIAFLRQVRNENLDLFKFN